MDIFDVLSMVGGLALLLYGMEVMGKSLEKLSGGRLETILEKMTSNRIKAVLLGAAVTAAIQSSSATTVMVVGFVNSGIMKLNQAVGIIMGANIGTTITSWILSLAGLDDSNIFLKLLKPTSFAPVLALVGIIFIMFSKKEKKRDIGSILLGFTILMTGMDIMGDAVSGLTEIPEFKNIMLMFSNPILGMLAGAVLTGIIQSSAASIGILQAFCLSGSITFGTAIPIIMGQNIGTCVTAVLSSLGASKNAKRTAAVHLYFNLVGTLVFMAIFYGVDLFVNFAFLEDSISSAQIALIHSLFNVGATILLFPFANVLEKLAVWTIKDKDGENAAEDEFRVLDDRFLDTPGYALEQCKLLTNKMAHITRDSLFDSIALLEAYDEKKAEELMETENLVDRYEDELGYYLVKLSSKNLSEKDSKMVSNLLHSIGNWERISDHAVNLCDTAKEIYEKKLSFSEQAEEELQVFSRAIHDILSMTVEAFEKDNIPLAKKVEPLEEVIDSLNCKIKDRHVKRLQAGECTIELGFVLTDILGNYERVSDHCSNLAVSVIQTGDGEVEAHEYLDSLKSAENEQFRKDYQAVKKQYLLPVIDK